jgi:hypothetical protein
MDTLNEAFHKSTKPCWGPNGTLVYTTTSVAPPLSGGVMVNFGASVVGQHTDVRFAKLDVLSDVSFYHLQAELGVSSNMLVASSPNCERASGLHSSYHRRQGATGDHRSWL